MNSLLAEHRLTLLYMLEHFGVDSIREILFGALPKEKILENNNKIRKWITHSEDIPAWAIKVLEGYRE